MRSGNLFLPLFLIASTAHSIDISNVPKEQWPSLAQNHLSEVGPVLGIPGGVAHSIPQNQEFNSNCWAYAITGCVEAFVNAKRPQGQVSIKLAPEYNEFWHFYQQFQSYLPKYQQMISEMQAAPKSTLTRNRIAKITDSFGLVPPGQTPPKHPKRVRGFFKVPEAGTLPDQVIPELKKFGVVPFQMTRTHIRTDEQAKRMDAAIRALVGQMLLDAYSGKADLSQFAETNATINAALAQKLNDALTPVFGVRVPLPSDAWTDITTGKSHSALGYLEELKNRGFNPDRFKIVNPTLKSSQAAMQQVAESLLTTDLPTLIDFLLYEDKLADGTSSIDDFVNATGVFTNEICPGGKCTSVDSGHMTEVVNFIGKMTDGSVPRDLTRAQTLDLVRSGKLQVTGLIIKNSWGANGVDINGKIPAVRTKTGYYVLTSGYLNNGFLIHQEDPCVHIVFDALQRL